MANTGYKQATIAYKVSTADGSPVDINGSLISVSGRRQAIALLTGYTNPDETLYEVEQTFSAGDSISGNSTRNYDTDSCPITVISDFTISGQVLDQYYYDQGYTTQGVVNYGITMRAIINGNTYSITGGGDSQAKFSFTIPSNAASVGDTVIIEADAPSTTYNDASATGTITGITTTINVMMTRK